MRGRRYDARGFALHVVLEGTGTPDQRGGKEDNSDASSHANLQAKAMRANTPCTTATMLTDGGDTT